MESVGIYEGFDVGLEMSGSPIAFSGMLELMINGGTSLCLQSCHLDQVLIGIWLFLKGLLSKEFMEEKYLKPGTRVNDGAIWFTT